MEVSNQTQHADDLQRHTIRQTWRLLRNAGKSLAKQGD